MISTSLHSSRLLGARNARPRLTAALIGGGVVSVGVVLALLIGISAWMPLAAGLVLVAGVALLLLGLGTVPQGLLRSLLVLAAVVVLVSPLSQQHLKLPVGYVLELVLFSLALGALLQARVNMGQDRALRWLGGLFVLYLALGVLSSVFGRSHWVAGLWQFQYNLKWMAMFLVGTLLVWDARSERVLRWILLTLWLPLLAFVLLEWFAPALHRQLFGVPTDNQINPLLGALRRFRGPLLHSGYLALMSATLAWFCVVFALRQRQWRWAWLAVPYAVLLIAAGQRQETLGICLALALLATLQLRRQGPLLLVVALLLGGAAVSLALLFDYVPLSDLLAQWGAGDQLAPLSERAILSKQGLGVANANWPLGSGLGTYGGAGAQKFDQSLFVELGFGRYWWFREGKFLVDVYWPSVAAESGWLAAVALATCFGIVFFGLLRRLLRLPQGDTALMLALGGLLILLSNTPSSAIITDPRGSFLLWLVIGAAWRGSQGALAAPAAMAGGGIAARRWESA